MMASVMGGVFDVDPVDNLKAERRQHPLASAGLQIVQQATAIGGVDHDQLIHIAHDHMGVVTAQPLNKIVQHAPTLHVEIRMRIAGYPYDIAPLREIRDLLPIAMIDNIAILASQHLAIMAQPGFEEKRIIAHHGEGTGCCLHLLGPFSGSRFAATLAQTVRQENRNL